MDKARGWARLAGPLWGARRLFRLTPPSRRRFATVLAVAIAGVAVSADPAWADYRATPTSSGRAWSNETARGMTRWGSGTSYPGGGGGGPYPGGGGERFFSSDVQDVYRAYNQDMRAGSLSAQNTVSKALAIPTSAGWRILKPILRFGGVGAAGLELVQYSAQGYGLAWWSAQVSLDLLLSPSVRVQEWHLVNANGSWYVLLSPWPRATMGYPGPCLQIGPTPVPTGSPSIAGPYYWPGVQAQGFASLVSVVGSDDGYFSCYTRDFIGDPGPFSAYLPSYGSNGAAAMNLYPSGQALAIPVYTGIRPMKLIGAGISGVSSGPPTPAPIFGTPWPSPYPDASPRGYRTSQSMTGVGSYIAEVGQPFNLPSLNPLPSPYPSSYPSIQPSPDMLWRSLCTPGEEAPNLPHDSGIAHVPVATPWPGLTTIIYVPARGGEPTTHPVSSASPLPPGTGVAIDDHLTPGVSPDVPDEPEATPYPVPPFVWPSWLPGPEVSPGVDPSALPSVDASANPGASPSVGPTIDPSAHPASPGPLRPPGAPPVGFVPYAIGKLQTVFPLDLVACSGSGADAPLVWVSWKDRMVGGWSVERSWDLEWTRILWHFVLIAVSIGVVVSVVLLV